MHWHSGTVVPVYTLCLHTAINVLGGVAFTLLVQNESCTILPMIYIVVRYSLCAVFHY
jgi:hypothetical protein